MIRCPPPGPKLLVLHAACAKVIHGSGAAEVIDKDLQDMEEINVLASNGGHADNLHDALYLSGAAIAVEMNTT
ncbi:hypothetical protein OBBRIDRAFT_734122 [Obba rivulosa]|uniref:Uncharacterized protein n=1 Tax=Obba rivulosa TaxID=1052685 RepID=A0A8E2APQ1_9APHY|nr:hypothetical protein OBBRIDRAFT_734122 [Obba rivulosa]